MSQELHPLKEIEAIASILKIVAPFNATVRMRILEYAQNWSRDRNNAPVSAEDLAKEQP